jgi:hypothetical protein
MKNNQDNKKLLLSFLLKHIYLTSILVIILIITFGNIITANKFNQINNGKSSLSDALSFERESRIFNLQNLNLSKDAWDKYYSSQVGRKTDCNNNSENLFVQYCKDTLSALNSAQAKKERIRYQAEQDIVKAKEERLQKEKEKLVAIAKAEEERLQKEKEKQENFEIDLEVEYKFSDYLIDMLPEAKPDLKKLKIENFEIEEERRAKLKKQMETYYGSRQLKKLIDSNNSFLTTIKKTRPDKYESYGQELSLYNQISMEKSNLEFTIRKNRKGESDNEVESPQLCQSAFDQLTSIAEKGGFSSNTEFDPSRCSEYIKTYLTIKGGSTNP